ncbi:hypothetical protein PtB15_7B199 [Puccinia triticina]|nr:hypothetical protein PtB15_7B199 [Puccinia triticina]
MEEPRTSIVFQAQEEMTGQRHSEVADEERRLHILHSIAKLEGNSKPLVAQTSPIKKVNPPRQPGLNRCKIQSNPHPFPLAPYPTGLQSFAPTLPVPYFCYPPFAPNNVAIMPSSMMTYPIYLPMTSGPLVSKHSTAPSPELRKDSSFPRTKPTSTLPATPRQLASNNEIMKTPERSSRAQSSMPSLESTPESILQTPSPINSYNPASKQQIQYQQRFSAEPLETCRPRHSHCLQSHTPSRDDKMRTRAPIERRSCHNASDKKITDNYENLIKSGNYGLQLESKKTGVKLAEKKRLTINELKFLEVLPPLPPRPELQRSSLSSSSNLSFAPKSKKKQDKFAWFDYCLDQG